MSRMKKVKIKSPSGKMISVNSKRVSVGGRDLVFRELLLHEALEIQDLKDSKEKTKKQIELSVMNEDMSVEDKKSLFYELTASDSVKVLKVLQEVNDIKVNPLD